MCIILNNFILYITYINIDIQIYIYAVMRLVALWDRRYEFGLKLEYKELCKLWKGLDNIEQIMGTPGGFLNSSPK